MTIRKLAFRSLFVLYALFAMACAALVVMDPIVNRPPGGNIGAGMLGFMAAGAAGLPWSLLMFPIFRACEEMRQPAVCRALDSDASFAYLCAIGVVINLWLLGALAQFWRLVPWKRAATPSPP